MNNPGKLHLDNVVIHLNDKVLIDITETILPGEVLTIMGDSGSGKSTLLAYIGGFLDQAFTASGEVTVGDASITSLPAEQRRVGILFQDPLLFPHMSVGDNLLFAIPPIEKGRTVRRAIVEDALNNANLADCYSRDPATLSGGQRARVALMRVLLARPKALLLDEPFSKLDSTLKGRIRQFVLDEARRQMLPVLLVTHDNEDAVAAGGRVFKL